MSGIRIVAAICMLAAIVALLVADDTKLWALPLIVGNLLVIVDDWRARRGERA